jgi:uncharacterized protein with PQ loop repeat
VTHFVSPGNLPVTFDLLLNALLITLGVFTIGTNTLRVVKCRSTEGIALSSTVLATSAALSWTAYGIGYANTTQVLVNVLGFIGFGTVLVIGHMTGALHLRVSTVAVGAYALFATGVVHYFGFAGLGLTVSLLTFAIRAPQVHKVWTQPGGSGLSIAGQAGDVAQSSLWLLSGVLLMDPWMMATSAYCGATSAFIGARTHVARRTQTQPAFESERTWEPVTGSTPAIVA